LIKIAQSCSFAMKSEVTTLWRFTNMLIIVAVVIIIIITPPSKSVNPCVGTTSNIPDISHHFPVNRDVVCFH